MTVKYQRNCHGRRAGHWTPPTSLALQECLQAWPASHRYKPGQLGTACSSWRRAVRQEVKSATAGELEKTQAAVTAGPGHQSTLYHPLRKRLLCKNRIAEPLLEAALSHGTNKIFLDTQLPTSTTNNDSLVRWLFSTHVCSVLAGGTSSAGSTARTLQKIS